MAEQQMTPEQAVLYQQVYVPAFVEKAAELGLSFDNDQALDEALETTALLKMSMNNQHQGVIKRANQSLKQHLGMDLVEAEQARTEQLKTAAQAASQNPEVRQALLTGTLGD